MNIKKILSTALVAVMLFTTIVAAVPVTSSAAYSSSSVDTDAVLGSAEIKAIVNTALTYNFNNAEEMLRYELGIMSDAEAETFGLAPNAINMLDYTVSSDAKYIIYANRYTGAVYYVNAVTGQILTSNPYNVAYTTGTSDKPTATEDLRQQLMSQLTVSFFKSSDSSVTYEYNSIKWASLYSQVTVSPVSGGLRVNYTLGDTSTRFLLPGMLIAETFENKIFKPLLDSYAELLETYCREAYPDTNFHYLDNPKYASIKDGYIDTDRPFKTYLSDMNKLATAVYPIGTEGYEKLYDIYQGMAGLFTVYGLQNPQP